MSLGFRVWNTRLKIQRLMFDVHGFVVWDLGLRAEGRGLMVEHEGPQLLDSKSAR